MKTNMSWKPPSILTEMEPQRILIVDDEPHIVRFRPYIDGRPIDLTLKEYELLRLFLLTPRRVLPRHAILDNIWGYDFYGSENNVEVCVGYLRRKLGDRDHTRIETVRGVGYRLNV